MKEFSDGLYQIVRCIVSNLKVFLETCYTFFAALNLRCLFSKGGDGGEGGEGEGGEGEGGEGGEGERAEEEKKDEEEEGQEG